MNLKKYTKLDALLPKGGERNILGLRGFAVLGTNAIPFLAEIDRSIAKWNSNLKIQYHGFLSGILMQAARGPNMTKPYLPEDFRSLQKVIWTFAEAQAGGRSFRIAIVDDPLGSFLTLLLFEPNGGLADTVTFGRAVYCGGFRWKVVSPAATNQASVIVWRNVMPASSSGQVDWGATLGCHGTNYSFREKRWARPVERVLRGPLMAFHPPIGISIREGKFIILPGDNDLKLQE